MEYPPCKLDTIEGMENFVPNDDGTISRLGYRNFFGLVWVLIKANRTCKRLDTSTRMNFKLPVKWL